MERGSPTLNGMTTASRPAGSAPGPGAGAAHRRRRWGLGAALIALAATATVGGWYVGQTRAAGDRPLERFSHVHGLDAPAWAAGDLFVATHHGLARVTPGGAWTAVGDERHDLMGFRAHPSEADTLYASGHPDLRSDLANPTGLLVSTDRGRRWRPLALAGHADFHSLSVQQGDGDVLVGFNAMAAELLRSLDGGTTWAALDAGAPLQAGGILSLEVHPTDPDRLLAGTPSGLWATDDGGATWRVEAWPGVAVTALRYAANGRLYAYGAHPDLGLVARQDGGWAPLGLVLGGGDVVGYVAPHPTDPATVYVGSLGMDVLATTDGGATWRHLAERGVPAPP